MGVKAGVKNRDQEQRTKQSRTHTCIFHCSMLQDTATNIDY